MNNHEAQGSQGAADSVPTDSQGQTEPSSSTPLQPEDPVGRSRSQPPWLILGIGAIAIVAGGGAWWLHAARYESTNDAQITAHIYQVSSQVPGKVQAVSITENQAVKVGELLVRLDPNDYQVKVEQAEAALAVAKRQAQAAQTSVTVAATTARAQTTQAQGNVQAAQAAI
ncbi:MAG: biotin/lipoyl-binding protein, partial [Cyanobacteria bacterium P01_H01_bin.121]